MATYLLLEDGSKILLEDGVSAILLEAGGVTVLSATGYRGLDAPPPGDLEKLRPWFVSAQTKSNQILLGKLNVTTTITLTPNATSTTLTDPRIGATTVPILVPTTANAAADMNSMYQDAPGKGTVVIHHANNANSDRTFNVVVIG